MLNAAASMVTLRFGAILMSISALCIQLLPLLPFPFHLSKHICQLIRHVCWLSLGLCGLLALSLAAAHELPPIPLALRTADSFASTSAARKMFSALSSAPFVSGSDSSIR